MALPLMSDYRSLVVSQAALENVKDLLLMIVLGADFNHYQIVCHNRHQLLSVKEKLLIRVHHCHRFAKALKSKV
jgi:hypothetical protein